MDGERFLLTVSESVRYVRDLATRREDSFVHPLGYTFLTLLEKQGLTSRPIPITDTSGVTYARHHNSLRRFHYIVKRMRAGDRIIGLGMEGVCAALVSRPLGRSASVFVYLYTAGPPHRSVTARLKEAVRAHGLRAASLVAVSTQVERDRAVDRFGLEGDRTVVFRSGVDTRFFSPPEGRGGASLLIGGTDLTPGRFVLMPGDMLRLEDVVFRALEGTSTHIVRTSKSDVGHRFRAALDRFSKRRFEATFLHDVQPLDLRELYRNAACVIVAADSSWQPAGWTTMTEAMACGTPTLVSRGINTKELKVIASDSGGEAPEGEWDFRDPMSLTPLVEQCLSGRWPQSKLNSALELVRSELDVEVVARRLFANQAWRTFAGQAS